MLALGALAAEPLYVLVDTAIVGHLGRSQLAALAIASTVLSSVFAVFNFLQYGTTAQTARASGAGEHVTARQLGAQTLWLSSAIGVTVAAVSAACAGPLVDAMGGGGRTAHYAVLYLRIACLGLPFAFVALGAQGYLRGVNDLRSPLVIVLGGNILNAVLEVLFVYGFHWGISGSAWGTVAAQALMGAAFIARVLPRDRVARRPSPVLIRRLLSLGRHIFVRTAALLGSFVLTTAVVARFGDAPLAAHQIAFQIWLFLALVLDAVAIAGQVIVGRELGAARADVAYDASVRMIVWSFLAGVAFAAVMLALEPLLPLLFTGDDAVIHQAHRIWWIFALMQPVNGIVFALDGILIGAGDGRYLAAAMVASFAACAAVSGLTLAFDWGLPGAWAALATLLGVRLATLLPRFARRRWLVVGWT